MIAELGLAALWLAAALAALQFAAGVARLVTGDELLGRLVRPVAIVQGLLAALAFAALVYLFAVTDLSVELVARNSHSEKPLIFKLSGTWGQSRRLDAVVGDDHVALGRADRLARTSPA